MSEPVSDKTVTVELKTPSKAVDFCKFMAEHSKMGFEAYRYRSRAGSCRREVINRQ
jgi:hypothetical protein